MRLWLFLPVQLPNSFRTLWLVSDNSQETHTVGEESVLPSKEMADACQLWLDNKESTSERYYQRGMNWKESLGHTLGQSRETNPGNFILQRVMVLQYLPPVFQHHSPMKGAVCCQFKKNQRLVLCCHQKGQSYLLQCPRWCVHTASCVSNLASVLTHNDCSTHWSNRKPTGKRQWFSNRKGRGKGEPICAHIHGKNNVLWVAAWQAETSAKCKVTNIISWKLWTVIALLFSWNHGFLHKAMCIHRGKVVGKSASRQSRYRRRSINVISGPVTFHTIPSHTSSYLHNSLSVVFPCWLLWEGYPDAWFDTQGMSLPACPPRGHHTNPKVIVNTTDASFVMRCPAVWGTPPCCAKGLVYLEKWWLRENMSRLQNHEGPRE